MPGTRRGRRGQRRSHIVRGDRVRVIRGNYRDAEGVVLRVDVRAGRVVVEGINMCVRHQRPTQQNAEGGIVSFEAPLNISNVMLIEPDSGEASRVRLRRARDGSKERLSVRNGNPVPRP